MHAAIGDSVGGTSPKSLSMVEACNANPGERAARETRTYHRSNTLVPP